MGVADGLVANLINVMARLNGTEQSMYLRTITDVGEDKITGTRGTPQVVDTLVTPPPFISNVSYREIQVSGGKIFDGDYSVLLPPTYTRDQILSTYAVINGEQCMPAKVEDFVLEGKVVWIKVLYSRKRTVGQQV